MGNRIYEIEGQEYISVTSVLDIVSKGEHMLRWASTQACNWISRNLGNGMSMPELLENAKSSYALIRDEAADIGTAVHECCEVYAKHNLKVDTSEMRREVQLGFQAFLKWQKENEARFLKSEFTVHSAKHAYAGTLDAVCVLGRDNKKFILDFKTSNAFYDTFPLQLAAYREAAREMGYPTDGQIVLRLDKHSGTWQVRDYSKDHEKHLDSFLKLLDFYYAFKSRRLNNHRTQRLEMAIAA